MSRKTSSEHDGDAAILAAFDRWRQAREHTNQQHGEEAIDAAADAESAIFAEIAAMQAGGAAGLVVKIVALADILSAGLAMRGDPEAVDGKLWRSVIGDARRFLPELDQFFGAMLQPVGPVPFVTDEELIAAERELAELRCKPREDDRDDENDPVFDLYDRIMATEPRSLRGAAVKLRVILDPDIGIPSGESEVDIPGLQQVLAFIEREVAQREGRS